MTEAEWLACQDPQRMLTFVVGKASDRKLRLFACACCRGVWGLLHSRAKAAVRMAERFAEGNADEMDLLGASYNLELVFDHAAETGRESTPADRAAYAAAGEEPTYWAPHAARHAEQAAEPTGTGAGPRQAALLRDVFGSPHAIPIISQNWLTPDVRGLARTLYRTGRSPSGDLNGDLMAVLSDALEEAGCADERILSHLRSAGPHVRGCWVIDLILGKQ